MLPNEWQRVPVGKVCNSIVPGRNKPKYFDGDIPWVTTPEISGRYVPSALQKNYVSETVLKECGGKIVPKGAVVMAAVGELGLVALAAEKVVLNQQLHAFVCSNSVHNEYLAYALKAQKYYMESVASKTTIPYMNKTNCESIPVPLPPLPEQKKIAQILSAWDQAITATKRLLENSQQRKKGLMQQLLTGKKRLPGFEEEWQKIELGEALKYQQPTPFLVRSTEYSNDFPTPVLTAGKSFLLGYSDEEFGIYRNVLPTIIFDDFTTASRFVDFPFKVKSSAIKILTSNSGFSTRYLLEAMQMIRFKVGGHQRHWISIFANLVIPCPSFEEQKAISKVLATADHEISALQNFLKSLKKEKKALMQQLLTGKRRVQVEAA
jgi:type I restriction enzyme S subunit